MGRAPHLREEIAAFVMFRFRMMPYFDRHIKHGVVANLRTSYLNDEQFRLNSETLTACVPHECCMRQPAGQNSSINGLHMVLWNLLTEFLLSLRLGETVPLPEPSDFEEIYEIDPEQPTAKWELCYRS